MTQPDPDQAAKAEAIEFAHRLLGRWQEVLGAELVGAYLIGSLAHEGFSRRYSDVDLGLVTTAGLSEAMLARLRDEAAALSAAWGPKVSIFWTDRRFSLGRFPPLDRIDYLDHAVKLIERERVRPPRPALEEIRHYLREAPFAGWVGRAQSFASAATLAPQDRKAYLRTHLYPARLCYSWRTGRMGSNDEAVAHLRQNPVDALDIALVERALQCRRDAADPDTLFPARVALPAQVDACAAMLHSGARAKSARAALKRRKSAATRA